MVGKRAGFIFSFLKKGRAHFWFLKKGRVYFSFLKKGRVHFWLLKESRAQFWLFKEGRVQFWVLEKGQGAAPSEKRKTWILINMMQNTMKAIWWKHRYISLGKRMKLKLRRKNLTGQSFTMIKFPNFSLTFLKCQNTRINPDFLCFQTG